MKLFKSIYPQLGFYVNGEYRKFQNGEYRTNIKKEIDVLQKISGVTEVQTQVESNLEKYMVEQAEKTDKKPTKKVKK